MLRAFEVILNGISLFGINPRQTIAGCKGFPAYLRDYVSFRRQSKALKFDGIFPLRMPFPCLSDRYTESGDTSGTYFFQDLHVAQCVYANNPESHVDVGSRISGFFSHVASFRKITVLDIRKLTCTIPNVVFEQCDIMNDIPGSFKECTDSLSCLHAMEHFGLGRYGDPICVDGYIRGINHLTQILRKGGRLYFSVPIGPQRIEFNAHRVFSVRYLFDLFEHGYILKSFSFIDDGSNMHWNVNIDGDSVSRNFGCNRGLGILELIKR